MRPWSLTRVCVALWLGATLPAQAQILGGDYLQYGMPNVNFAAVNTATMSSVISGLKAGSPARAAPVSATTLAPGHAGRATARQLALRYPADQRPRIEPVFEQMLGVYAAVADRLGVPADDMATSLAAYLVGNYMAMKDVDVPDAHFQTVVAQVRPWLANSAALAQTAKPARRAHHEELAIVGTFMAATRLALRQQAASSPVVANFRHTARANLEQALGADADRLDIGSQGLRLR